MKYEFRPSASGKWLHCSLFPYLGTLIEAPSGPWAEEGSHAHELAEGCLKGSKRCLDFSHPVELQEAINRYIVMVGERRRRHKDTKQLVEIELSLFDGTGTSDVLLHSMADRMLYAGDYKHGKGIYVPAMNNSQLAWYLCAAMKHLGRDSFDRIEGFICQPRNWQWKSESSSHSWTVTNPKAFWTTWITRFKAARKRAKTDPRATLGEHCHFCDAKFICPAFKPFMEELLDDVAFASPAKMPRERINEILRMVFAIYNFTKTIHEGNLKAFKLKDKETHNYRKPSKAFRADVRDSKEDIYAFIRDIKTVKYGCSKGDFK
jgi:hypothetical protein